MTVNRTEYTNWHKRTDWLAPKYEQPSPNLLQIRRYLIDRWGGVSLGIHGNRPIRGGEDPSEHAFGAALDWRWAYANGFTTARFITRQVLDNEVLPFLIENSLELHIQGIHDEGRVWRSDRPGVEWDATWRDYNTGYNGWIHIVTTDGGFLNNIPVETRLSSAPPQLFPIFDPHNEKWGLWPVSPVKPVLRFIQAPHTMNGDVVKYLQGVIFFKAGGNISIDGFYGRQTERRVKDLQSFLKINDALGAAHGTMTPKTWAMVDFLATR